MYYDYQKRFVNDIVICQANLFDIFIKENYSVQWTFFI